MTPLIELYAEPKAECPPANDPAAPVNSVGSEENNPAVLWRVLLNSVSASSVAIPLFAAALINPVLNELFIAKNKIMLLIAQIYPLS